MLSKIIMLSLIFIMLLLSVGLVFPFLVSTDTLPLFAQIISIVIIMSVNCYVSYFILKKIFR
jgi:hypothetical protein